MKRREFLKKAGVGATAAVAATAGTVVNAPFVHASQKSTIRWRLQTYAGPALAEHVIKPQIEAFNKAANNEMVIELYNADQLIPTGELFRAMQRGTIDAVQSDDDSIAAPVDVSIFAAYFPFASRYSLDVPTLFNHYGLKEIWEEAYSEVDGVKWLSAGSWDPCNFATREPIRSVKDLKGKRVFTFPTGGRFLKRFGVVPVTLPWEDVEVALQTGELDGIAWSGITEDYTVGWADVTKYYLTNNISGAWAGSYFANSDKWEALPEHLKTLFKLSMDSSHYYRLHWYWWGEAYYRTHGGKLELTTIPEEEWSIVENEAMKYWDELAAKSPRSAKIVKILKEYTETMKKAGKPYRY
ncbi:TRAP transporter substrate-binding protein [Desulfovibrio ferrophilus]|uniref:TRAP dicarboxylate transporter subunit DctP n=1 Tax=Desulfovibrio ferrophilus TaxID=241368 RepID=A0A2Z6AUY8_9BACT|nr:TRAP transporter substrate-binding protein [Desulfovibrio ferrophilus]BBD06996.1 TRAP dicarboxylate transporter subunit DctP [Desulfovibrio ferrophilus]